MSLRRLSNRGEIGIEQVVKWVLAIGVIIAAGFAIRNVVMRFG